MVEALFVPGYDAFLPWTPLLKCGRFDVSFQFSVSPITAVYASRSNACMQTATGECAGSKSLTACKNGHGYLSRLEV